MRVCILILFGVIIIVIIIVELVFSAVNVVVIADSLASHLIPLFVVTKSWRRSWIELKFCRLDLLFDCDLVHLYVSVCL